MEAPISVVRRERETQTKQKDRLPPSPATVDKLRETVEASAAVRCRCYDRIGPTPSYRRDTKEGIEDSAQLIPEAEGRVPVSALKYFRPF